MNIATSNEALLLPNGPLAVQHRGEALLPHIAAPAGKTEEEILKPEKTTIPSEQEKEEQAVSKDMHLEGEDKVATTAPLEPPSTSSVGESANAKDEVSDNILLQGIGGLKDKMTGDAQVVDDTPLVSSPTVENDQNIINPPAEDALATTNHQEDVVAPPEPSKGDQSDNSTNIDKQHGVKRHNSANIILHETKEIIHETLEHFVDWVKDKLHKNNTDTGGPAPTTAIITMTAEEQAAAAATEARGIIMAENDACGADIIAVNELPPGGTLASLESATKEDAVNAQGAPNATADCAVSPGDVAQPNGETTTSDNVMPLACVVPNTLDEPANGEEILVNDILNHVVDDDEAQAAVASSVDAFQQQRAMETEATVGDTAAVDLPLTSAAIPTTLDESVEEDKLDQQTPIAIESSQNGAPSNVDVSQQTAIEMEASIHETAALKAPPCSAPSTHDEFQEDSVTQLRNEALDGSESEQVEVSQQATVETDVAALDETTDDSPTTPCTPPTSVSIIVNTTVSNESREDAAVQVETETQAVTDCEFTVDTAIVLPTLSAVPATFEESRQDIAPQLAKEAQVGGSSRMESFTEVDATQDWEYFPAPAQTPIESTANPTESESSSHLPKETATIFEKEEITAERKVESVKDWEEERNSLSPKEPEWAKPKLKSTKCGESLRQCGEAPLTRSRKKNICSDVNVEANPMALKSTGLGNTLRNGGDIIKPVSRDLMSDINFEANPALALRQTDTGKSIKEGRCLQKPITNVEKSAAADINFDANPSILLRSTETGRVAKEKGNLQKPITKDMTAHINAEANPMTLRMTDKGAAVRLGGDIIKPVTRDHMADINFEANPAFVLRESDTGKSIKEGHSLQKPITMVEKSAAADINFDANPSILLRSTETGKLAKEKGNLQKPITKITHDETAHINIEANPMMLRPTDKGAAVRLGGDLVKPITRDHMADVNFEANPTFALRETETGKSIKNGRCLQKPITNVEKSSATGVNFEANPAISLRSTETGKVAKEKGDLQKPVTKDVSSGINMEANPMMLHHTSKGAAVRLGGDLAKPLTRDPMADVNFEANPFVLRETETGKSIKNGHCLQKPITNVEKSAAADVNFDANPAILLRNTEMGKVAKEKGDLQKPITKDETAHINVEANPMILRPIDKGSELRLDGNLTKQPIITPLEEEDRMKDNETGIELLSEAGSSSSLKN